MHRLLVLLAAFLVACPSGDDEGTPVPVDDDDAGAPGNSSPTVPSISISPAAPGVDDDVVCSIETESVDPEGDEITYSFSWLLDDADAGVETSTLPSARTGAEEFWTCVVRASDGLLASGVVEATGEKVTKFRPGDLVFAYGAMSAMVRRFGSYAEFLCLPEEWNLLGKPEGLSHKQAAALPYGGFLAWHCVHGRI